MSEVLGPKPGGVGDPGRHQESETKEAVRVQACEGAASLSAAVTADAAVLARIDRHEVFQVGVAHRLVLRVMD